MSFDINEVDAWADKYISLQNKSLLSREDKKVFKKYQNEFAENMNSFIDAYVGKYKKFSNYKDLKQDGFAEMLHAFKTFKAEKGSFAYWAKLYVETKLPRSANKHSTFHVPMSKAKEEKPIKVDEMPDAIFNKNFISEVENNEILNKCKELINSLSKIEREIFDFYFKFEENYKSQNELCQALNITSRDYTTILSKIKKKLSKLL